MNTYVEFSKNNSQYPNKNIQITQVLGKYLWYGKSMALGISKVRTGIPTPPPILTYQNTFSFSVSWARTSLSWHHCWLEGLNEHVFRVYLPGRWKNEWLSLDTIFFSMTSFLPSLLPKAHACSWTGKGPRGEKDWVLRGRAAVSQGLCRGRMVWDLIRVETCCRGRLGFSTGATLIWIHLPPLSFTSCHLRQIPLLLQESLLSEEWVS